MSEYQQAADKSLYSIQSFVLQNLQILDTAHLVDSVLFLAVMSIVYQISFLAKVKVS